MAARRDDADRVNGPRNAPSQTQSGGNKFIYSLTAEAKRVALLTGAGVEGARPEKSATGAHYNL